MVIHYGRYGSSLGTAHVVFWSPNDAEEARMHCNGTFLFDRELKMRYATWEVNRENGKLYRACPVLNLCRAIRLFRLMFVDERYVGDFALIALFGATVRLQDGPQFLLEKTPA